MMHERDSRSVSACGHTDIGQYDHNEDAFLIDLDLGLIIVSDGVGGHRAGELASQMTCGAVARDISSGMTLERAIRNANNEILSSAGEINSGMGCTIVAVLLQGSGFELAWVGDSRAYLWSDNRLGLLTRDHSMVQTLVEKGKISPEEARYHPRRHVILQAVGFQSDSELTVGLNQGSLQKGQVLLLCTDGVSDILDDRQIADTLTDQDSLQSRCKRLVKMAIANGGKDNATAVLIASDAESSDCAEQAPELVWSYDRISGKYTDMTLTEEVKIPTREMLAIKHITTDASSIEKAVIPDFEMDSAASPVERTGNNRRKMVSIFAIVLILALISLLVVTVLKLVV